MADRNLLDNIFKKMDSKKAGPSNPQSEDPAPKKSKRRGMRKMSEYQGEERERKELHMKQMQAKAIAVNKEKAAIKLEALKASNPTLYEARRRAAEKLKKKDETQVTPPNPQPVPEPPSPPVPEKKEEKEVSKIADTTPETPKIKQAEPASESPAQPKIIPNQGAATQGKPPNPQPVSNPVPEPAKLVPVIPPKPKPIVYNLFRNTGTLW